MRLGFVGDICLGGGVAEVRARSGDAYPLSCVADEIRRLDVGVGNLECCMVDDRCCVSERGHPFAVRSAAMVEIRRSGFDALNLANNHILDCGVGGLEATVDSADRAGVTHFGAGNDVKRAGAVGWIEREGRYLAFLGACDRAQLRAGFNRPGVLGATREELGPRVRAAAAEADLVTVSLHADLEFVRYPAPWRIRLCRWLVDQGAHLVICHHPHVIQGIERYRHGVIAYSLGNFVFRVHGNRYQGHRSGVDLGLLLAVNVDFGSDAHPGLWAEPIPVKITEEHRPVPMNGSEREAVLADLDTLSAGLADPATVRRAWRATCLREVRSEVFGLYYALRRGELKKPARRLWELLTESEHWRWMLGFLTLGYR